LEVVESPQGKKIVGCKWIFLVKFELEGETERYKARLMAQ